MFERLKSLLDGNRKVRATAPLNLKAGAEEELSRVRVVEPPRPDTTKPVVPSPLSSPSNGVAFAVDDVTPASDPLWLSTLAESTAIRANATVLIMPDADSPALAPEGYGGKAVPGQSREPFRVMMKGLSAGQVARQLAQRRKFQHPLMEAVHLAFSDHRPLILSPDCIWLTIVQGFAHHVHENAEAFRSRIVRHSGKKELVVQTESIEPSRWPDLISQFSSKIREHSDPVLHETLVCEFSTTTPSIRTAYQVALMDAYERYFDYVMTCVCGIPQITVLGTVDDWQRIRERIEVLATFDLQWWTSRLEPILDQFVRTVSGNPDRPFWQAIYKPQKAYAAELASGWIADLFPYLFGGPAGRPSGRGTGLCEDARAFRNHVLKEPRVDWLLPVPQDQMRGVGVNLKNLPSGLSRARVKLTLPNGCTKNIELVGGFLGVSQRTQDYALAPVVSWALVSRN